MKLKEKFQRFWTLSKSHKGFTLVELIVVIAILAILAGVAIPVYNGYIKKAQEASDQQLLDTINTAFAAACLVNGIDHTNAVGELQVNDDGTILKNTSLSAAAYNPASNHYFDGVAVGGTDMELADLKVFDSTFASFYAGNEAAAFKGEQYVGKTLEITGETEDENGSNVTLNYGGATLSIPQKYVDALNKSGFITYDGLGTATLVGKLEGVTSLAESLIGTNSSGNASDLMNSVFGDPEFLAFMGEALDADLSTTEGQNKVAEEFLSKGVTMEELKANAAVLYASKSAATMDQSAIISLLTSGDAKQTILNNMASGNTTEAFSQAALAYGMYTSFAYSSYGNEDAKNKDEFGAMSDLNNTKFIEYMNSDAGKADLEGYIAALNMINTSTNSSDATSQLLINGFGDKELLDAINSALGNG